MFRGQNKTDENLGELEILKILVLDMTQSLQKHTRIQF